MRSEAGREGRSGRGPLLPSVVLIALLIAFCSVTHWGKTYPTFVRRTLILLQTGPSMPAEARRVQLYDETYPVILYIRDNTPENAVILIPPQQLIDEKTPGDIPLLSSPSSVYSFIYPRVPVNWGDPAPAKDMVNYVLVWKHWGLSLVSPGEPRTEENSIQICPWPAGKKLSW